MDSPLIPLFPLKLVLFPGSPLPLHIFEERYKEMIADVMETGSEFGIVLAREQGIVNTGCTATVEQVVNRYPDGRLDIVVMGQRRFELHAVDEEKPYLRGAVTFFDDELAAPANPADTTDAMLGFEKLRKLSETPVLVEPSGDDPQLSFRVAQVIDDLDFKLTLLGMRSEAERMRQLALFLKEYVVRQVETFRMKQVAPLNGHSRKPRSFLEG